MRPGQQDEADEIEWSASPGLTALHDLLRPLLDGGQPEHVTVLWDGRRADMFVDEDGVQKRLPVNVAATAIYRAAWLRRNPGTDPNSMPAIHGTAVLFERIVWH